MARCLTSSLVQACSIMLLMFLVITTISSVTLAQCSSGRCLLRRAAAEPVVSHTVTAQFTAPSIVEPSPQITVTATVSTAQEKAHRLAALGRLTHAGRLAGRYEGVGFSSRSADEAIRSCCYWGRRQPIDIGVARGARGWFAVVGYQ